MIHSHARHRNNQAAYMSRVFHTPSAARLGFACDRTNGTDEWSECEYVQLDEELWQCRHCELNIYLA